MLMWCEQHAFWQAFFVTLLKVTLFAYHLIITLCKMI